MNNIRSIIWWYSLTGILALRPQNNQKFSGEHSYPSSLGTKWQISLLGLTAWYLPSAEPSSAFQEFGRWISMVLQEFLLFFILQSKAQREWLWPIMFMLHSSRSTLHASTDRGIWDTSIKTALPLAETGASSTQESGTSKVSGREMMWCDVMIISCTSAFWNYAACDLQSLCWTLSFIVSIGEKDTWYVN